MTVTEPEFQTLDTGCNPRSGQLKVCTTSNNRPWADIRITVQQGGSDTPLTGLTDDSGCWSVVREVGFWDVKARTLGQKCEADWRTVEVRSCTRTIMTIALDEWCD
jgi:hypothetical protein